MRNKLWLLIMLCAVLSLCLLSACGGGTPPAEDEEDDWKPTGNDVTVIAQGANPEYVIVYSANETNTVEGANSFKNELQSLGLRCAPNAVPHTQNTSAKEIIFGDTDRKVSTDAKAYLAEVSKDTPDDLHWVFLYRDGKIAIYANSDEAYKKGVTDFFSKYIISGNLIVNDTLKYSGVMTRLAYNEEVAEQERIEAEKKEEERRQKIEELKQLISEQRTALSKKNSFKNPSRLPTSPFGKVSVTLNEGQHPRLMLTEDMVDGIVAALEEEDKTNVNFKSYLLSTVDGKLPNATEHTTGRKGKHNYDGALLETICAKALGYVLYGNELYGYEAIYAIKNYLDTLDIQNIFSDQCREYGNVMYITACVYDWCYDLLTEEDKTQIIAAVEKKICSGGNEAGAKMEVGFPPAGQGSIAGHGAEYQILRDYFAFAIAVYDENASWWNYIAPRVYNDYVKTRNYYFQSGISQQGNGTYAPFRHGADLYSGWIAKVATGNNPYVGMENTVRGFLGYECAPGKLFADGDGGTPAKDASVYQSHAFITAYLYGDADMLAYAESLGSSAYGAATTGLSCTAYVIMRGTGLEPSDNKYNGMDLIQYNGSPMGQYIIREAWNDAESCAVFMRIKERTTANHEHDDAGTFQIYYKGMLTNDGGVYNGYGNAHHGSYHQATVSHNGLLIFDSSKVASDAWYSGGQKGGGTITNKLSDWLTMSQYDTGKVTGRQHGYSDAAETKPLYAYIAGDITAAYDATTVNYVGRRMLTVYTGDETYPMVFFVYDDIESDKASYKKKFLLQISSDVEPTVIGNRVITENGEGRLVLTSLSEELENAVSIEKVGGRVYKSNGAYDPDNSQNYLINGVQCKSQDGLDDKHWGRIEIVSDEDSKEARFMNVIYVTDKGNTATVPVKSIDGDGVVGGVFNNKIVALFATSRTREKDEVAATVLGSGTRSYYVSGLAKGEWEVTVNGSSVGTFTVTEEGGLITFDTLAGDVVVTPKN